MIAPSSIATPLPNTTCGSISDVAADLRVHRQEHRLRARSASRPSSIARRRSRRCIAASAAASWTRSLTPITSSSRRDARLGAQARGARRSRRGRSGRIRAAALSQPTASSIASAGAPAIAIGPGVAAPDRPLGGARVLVLADGERAPVLVSMQAPVAGRVAPPRSRARRARRPRQAPRAAPASVSRGDQRRVGVGDQDVVVAARDRRARRERRRGRCRAARVWTKISAPRRAASRLGGDVVAVGADDDGDARSAPAAATRVERMGEHRPAGDFVQRLGARRAHAHALARREQRRRGRCGAARVIAGCVAFIVRLLAALGRRRRRRRALIRLSAKQSKKAPRGALGIGYRRSAARCPSYADPACGLSLKRLILIAVQGSNAPRARRPTSGERGVARV